MSTTFLPPVFALTGGIASGKSTVATLFNQLGGASINADELAHRVYEPGQEVYAALLERYGSGLLNAQGQINRSRLAEILFNSKIEKTWLEALIHPATRNLIGQKVQEQLTRGAPLVLVEAALHFESGYFKFFPGIILVDIREDLQKQRLAERDALTEVQIRQRLESQWPLEKKRSLSHWIIDNTGDLISTETQVQKLFQQLKNT